MALSSDLLGLSTGCAGGLKCSQATSKALRRGSGSCAMCMLLWEQPARRLGRGRQRKGRGRLESPWSHGKDSPALSWPWWSAEVRATGKWLWMVVFCCSCPPCKTFWALCRLKLCLCLLSGQLPLPIRISVRVVGALVASILQVDSRRVLPCSSFAHPFLTTYLRPGAGPSAWQLHARFPTSSSASMSISPFYQHSVSPLKRSRWFT